MPNQVITIDPQNELKFKVCRIDHLKRHAFPISLFLAAFMASGIVRLVIDLIASVQQIVDFAGMFEQGCTTYLRLGNPTSDTVLFKIKTTAPKKYCVRPNSGSLEPNSKVEIAITPQPVYIDPNEKHKHKFMVQSVIAPEGKTNVDQVWKEISSDQLMDYKLKCVFETPRVTSVAPTTNLNDSGDSGAQNEVPKKRAVEEAKPAKNMNFPKSENVENDLHNASHEVTHFHEEESKLRHENLQLKEELLRLRQMIGDGRGARLHMFGPEKQAQASLMPWLATAFAMALLGIIIGKYFM